MRHGATDYRVYRSRDDGYKFLQMCTFEDKGAWERYWYGPAFNDFRSRFSSYYQVPVLYVWNDLVIHGVLDEAPAVAGAPNGEY